MHFDATELIKNIQEFFAEDNYSVATNGDPFVDEVTKVYILRGRSDMKHRVLLCTITMMEQGSYVYDYAVGVSIDDRLNLELYILNSNL